MNEEHFGTFFDISKGYSILNTYYTYNLRAVIYDMIFGESGGNLYLLDETGNLESVDFSVSTKPQHRVCKDFQCNSVISDWSSLSYSGLTNGDYIQLKTTTLNASNTKQIMYLEFIDKLIDWSVTTK